MITRILGDKGNYEAVVMQGCNSTGAVVKIAEADAETQVLVIHEIKKGCKTKKEAEEACREYKGEHPQFPWEKG